MKFNNNFFYACVFTTSFVMFEGHSPLNGQSPDTANPMNVRQIEKFDNVEKDKIEKIDTVSTLVNKYTKLADKGAAHSKISKNQNDTLIKQARILAAQKKKIDSLLAIKEQQLRDSSVGDPEELADSDKENERKGVHRWGIFHIFDKK